MKKKKGMEMMKEREVTKAFLNLLKEATMKERDLKEKETNCLYEKWSYGSVPHVLKKHTPY